MTDLAITATQVLPGTADSATFKNGTAGAAVTAGQPVYKDSTTGKYHPADANASAITSVVEGIALHAAAADQPLKIQTGDDITLGAAASMTVGGVYVLSATAGGIAPVADLATGHRVSILGVAKTAAVLSLRIHNSQTVHA